jgi:ribosomal protein S18 acetylase RimI-like enzyme
MCPVASCLAGASRWPPQNVIRYATQMDVKPPHDDFSLLTGGAELLDRVEPLWAQLRRHHADLAPQWSASLLSSSFDKRRADLRNKGAGGLLVSMALWRGQDIGYCVSTIAADATGEVDSLYVDPSHRGSGVGHTLMSAAMDWFGRESVRSIVVEVISGNDAAQQFYARYGFLPRTIRLLRASGGVA